jgi:malonyl-CoA O-methyltransferase
MCAALRRAAPSTRVAAADAEALPFVDGAFDLVVSTSALQWLPLLDGALSEIARVLAPGGAACLALFGERTLHELRDAWAAAGGARPTHRFASRAEVEAALAAAGLDPVEVGEQELVEHHPDARAVLRALKAVGAQAASPGPPGLAGAGTTRDMLRRYDALRGPDGVPATYHVVRALARRPG